MGKWKWSIGALVVVLAIGLFWSTRPTQPQKQTTPGQKTQSSSSQISGTSQHPFEIASPAAQKYEGETAWTKYVNLAKASPKNAQAQVEAGVASFVNKKYPDAVTFYGNALTLDPKNPEYMTYLGNVYFWGLSQTAKAESYYSKATQVAPTYAYGWWGLARCYVAEGKTAQAKSTMTEALQKVPKSSAQYSALEAYSKSIK